MYHHTTPREHYRRIELDARVAGADPRQLVGLCYEQLLDALSLALHGDAIGENTIKSRALTRALSTLTALQLGVDRNAPISKDVFQYLEASRRTILDSVIKFDRAGIERLRSDAFEIAQAMQII